MFNNKPVIGILSLTRWSDVGTYKSNSFAFTGTAHIKSFTKNGGIPIMIPTDAVMHDAEDALSMCDAIYFPGGPDVCTLYYNEEPHPLLGKEMPDMDEAWLRAGKYALEHKIPMLGVCRGHQVLNVLMGGSLYQDISLQGPGMQKHMQVWDRTYLTHTVDVLEGTRLADMIGAGEHRTNSMHHQSVKALGEGLKVSAYAKDGTVEGIEDEEGLIVGVQWHPEDLTPSIEEMNMIFKDLVDRARQFSKIRK